MTPKHRSKLFVLVVLFLSDISFFSGRVYMYMLSGLSLECVFGYFLDYVPKASGFKDVILVASFDQLPCLAVVSIRRRRGEVLIRSLVLDERPHGSTVRWQVRFPAQQRLVLVPLATNLCGTGRGLAIENGPTNGLLDLNTLDRWGYTEVQGDFRYDIECGCLMEPEIGLGFGGSQGAQQLDNITTNFTSTNP